MLDLIVVGLGPAGLALAHRAQTYGWQVLGIDPKPEWDHTIGFWVDEVPDWLNVPIAGQCQPKVRSKGFSRTLPRDYAIIDAPAFRKQLSTFPILRESAEIIDAHTVRARHTHTARMVVDARGYQEKSGPFQQAAGCLVEHSEPWWMDIHGTTFTYAIPIHNQWLIERTILITKAPQPWSELESMLPTPTSDRVLFSMRIPRYSGPAIPFGVRAGMLNPVTGYSIGTAWRYIDDLLSGIYPWKRLSWRIEQWLLRRSQALLLTIDQERFFAEVFRLPDETLRRFLQLGDLPGTLRGMWALFYQAPWLRRHSIAALFKSG